MVHELRLASELQRSILPRGTPAGSPVNLARKYVPYQYIGGDFYDFVPLTGGRLGLVIADACGHGIAAAFLTAMFKSAFGLFAQASDSPAQALSRLNTEFVRTLMADNFMSAFYAILDGTSGELQYCSAGHPPQLLFRSSGEVVELSTMGFLLGSMQAAQFVDASLTLEPGDRLLLYTDGLVEAADAGGVQFGRQRVVETVRRSFASSLEDISNDLLSEAVMFLEEPTFQDDVTLILAELAEEI
jgi:sigma-B regulation protein RsbU (phosphoserine phosphatase)